MCESIRDSLREIGCYHCFVLPRFILKFISIFIAHGFRPASLRPSKRRRQSTRAFVHWKREKAISIHYMYENLRGMILTYLHTYFGESLGHPGNGPAEVQLSSKQVVVISPDVMSHTYSSNEPAVGIQVGY